MVEHWCAPPLYEDARAFLEAAPAPVYLVTNSDDHFVEEDVYKRQVWAWVRVPEGSSRPPGDQGSTPASQAQ